MLAASLRELTKIKSADKITIRELTKNCGLTSPTFYNHFRDKYELMAWIYNQKVEESLKNFGREDSFEDVICKWMEIILEDENFYINLLKNAVGQNSFRYATNDYAINLLGEWIKTRHNLRELTPEISFCIKFFMRGHGINIFHPEVEAAMDDMIKRIHALGKPVGTIALTTEQAKHFVDLGVSFLVLGGDTGFLTTAADNTLDTYKKFIEG